MTILLMAVISSLPHLLHHTDCLRLQKRGLTLVVGTDGNQLTQAMQRRSLCLLLIAAALLAAPSPAQAGFFDSIGDFFTDTIPNIAGNA